MKNKIFNFVLAIFLLITLTVAGQNSNYPIKKIKGIEYYLYTVQVSEGLFAIGRKFNLPPEDISKANPEIESGLKVGQQILIPVQNNTSKKNLEKAINNNSSPKFIEHKVLKNQTLFAISNKYNVSQEEIIKHNPEIEKGLREGIVLQIPKEMENKKKTKENTLASQSTIQTKNETEIETSGTHQIQAKETLYSIARLYKVKVIDIIRLNPGSTSRLTVGSELKIPTGGSSKISSNSSSNQNSSLSKDETLILPVNNKVIQIAFLLPFMLDSEKPDPTVERFEEFYAGALLAIEDAKRKGISLEIFTFDTEKSEEKITEVLSNPELKNMDLIIGPAFSNQVPLVASFAKENRVNTLIPFTSKVHEIENNSYLFQFNPGTDAEQKFTLDLLKGKYNNANIIFAEIPGISSYDEGRIGVEALQKEFIKERKHFSEIKLTTSDAVDFKPVLNKKVKNIIVFNTNKFTNINPFIAPVLSNSSDYEIVLFKKYNWKNQKNKLPQSVYISPFKYIVDSTKLNTFNERYTQQFCKDVSIDSPRFDLLGYDLSNYFISLIKRYSSNFSSKIESFSVSNYIQSLPHFERLSNGSGFINQRLYLGEDKSE